ncbi:MAG: hypothetical protein J5621_08120 [Paludibacteraceae bacterium]|nr:hypothetical protein [Paludibacteraceae bacterium]
MCKKSKTFEGKKGLCERIRDWWNDLKSKCSEKEEHEVREEEQEPLQKQEASDMPPKTYYPLTPTDEAKESESYLDALSWALSQNEIRNIAISGPYGSGKSSVIRTFFKKNPTYKYITISLANFNGGKDESTTEANKNESVQVDVKVKKGGKEQQSLSGLSDSQVPASDLEQRIERSIVQQLFYHEKDEKIPFSHFKKIHNDTPCDIHTETVCILLLIVSCVVLFYPTFFWKLPILKFLAYTERELFTLIAVFIVLGCLYVVIKKARKEILKHVKFRVLNAEIDMNANDEKSILNYYIDEIIYFFEATRKEIVIFEDLDRFNSRCIFVKLREINYLINNCNKIEQNVVFLYAIKDDVFIGKEKTKFFDFIIPVIPVVDYSNSGEILRNNAYLKSQKIKDQLIEDLSLFIDDLRLLCNIINEFEIYSQETDGNLPDKNGLLAFIAYKNLYPKDFSKLCNRDGLLYKIIDNKQEYIRKTLEAKEKELNEVHNKISNIEKVERPLNLKELRTIYLSQILSHIQQHFDGFCVNNSRKSLLECANNGELFDALIGNDYIQYYVSGYGRIFNIDVPFSAIEKEVHPTLSYKERADLICKTELEDLRKDENKLRMDKDTIAAYTLQDILKTQKIDTSKFEKDYPEEQLKCVKVLLRDGFVNENYWDYISKFYEGSLTPSDKQFLVNVKLHEPTHDYSHKLPRVENLIKQIPDCDFGRPYILNNALVDFVLSEAYDTTDETGEKKNKLFTLLTGNKHSIVSFVVQYLERRQHVDEFLKELCKRSDSIWKTLSKNFDKEQQIEYFQHIIRSCSVDDIVKQFSEDKTFIENYADFMSIDTDKDKLRDVVEKLDIKFSWLDKNIATEDLQFIYKGSYYALRPEIMFFPLIILMKDYDSTAYVYRNYSYIINHYPEMANYIQQNISTYIDDVYLKLASDRKQTIESYHLVGLINNENLSQKQKRNIIEVSECKVEIISEIEDVELRNELCRQNKMLATWENVKIMLDGDEDSKSACDTFLNIMENTRQLASVELQEDEDAAGQDHLGYKLMHRNDIKDEVFSILIRCAKFSYSGFEERTISESHMWLIVKNEKITASIEGYQYLKKYYQNLHIFMLEKNISVFKDKYSKLQFDADDIRKIVKSDVLDNETKQVMLNNTSVEELGKNDDTINAVLQWLLDSKTTEGSAPNQERMNLLALRANVDSKELKQFFLKYADKITDIFSFLKRLGKSYVNLIENEENIIFNKEDKAILDVLKNKHIIEKYRYIPGDGNYHVKQEWIKTN